MSDIFEYAYRKKSLEGLRPLADFPVEFLMEWYKDTFDRGRPVPEEDLVAMAQVPLEARLQWLAETAKFMWEVKLREWDPARADRITATKG